ncbi:unnamed protein product [Rhizophagus irregularis]|nr:unnamed protein product [Rhizophagus irregularis]
MNFFAALKLIDHFEIRSISIRYKAYEKFLSSDGNSLSQVRNDRELIDSPRARLVFRLITLLLAINTSSIALSIIFADATFSVPRSSIPKRTTTLINFQLRIISKPRQSHPTFQQLLLRMVGYALTSNVRLRISSERCRLACSYCTDFPLLAYFACFDALVYVEQLHSTDEGSVDCKDILGKFVLIGGRIIEENHKFCSMEGEHVLDEVEDKPAESKPKHRGILFGGGGGWCRGGSGVTGVISILGNQLWKNARNVVKIFLYLTMRLVTHNMLQCHVKGCNSNNFPLQLSDVEIEIQETDFNPKFLRNMLSKLEWNALVKTALEINITTLPNVLPNDLDEEFLKMLHRVLLETHIKQGQMICPNCNHTYPIKDGIPNMLLSETET